VIITYPSKVAAPQMKTFPMKMNTPPISATRPNLNGLWYISNHPSLAAGQKLLPVNAI